MGIYHRYFSFLPESLGILAVLWIHLRLARQLLGSEAAQRSPAVARAIRIGAATLAGWVACGFVASIPRAYVSLPPWPLIYWARGAALAWALALLLAYLIWIAWNSVPRYNPSRRGFVRAAGAAFVAAPFAVVGVGIFIQRNNLRVREVDVPMPNLPRDLDGLRLVQLSDIHMSPFLTEADLARAVDMANELKPNLALVTGDLITSRGDPLDRCLSQLARLRADAGILGCLGNHEIYAMAEQATTREGARLGIRFLRHQASPLRFGNATLNVAGVDYQRMDGRYLVGAERLLAPQAVNILLSHNPDVFDVAARKGFGLTIAGHTHGGQVNVEILSENLNLARFFTPYVYGLYRKGPASVWVTRGIGTVGLPARIGAPPEVALIRLCAI
jgi:uncharacterized protein